MTSRDNERSNGDMSSHSPSLAELDAALRVEAGPPHAANTRRAYLSDWADFLSWCTRYDLTPLPAEALTVRRYLVALAREGRKVATIQRRLAAIADAHARQGHPSPAADPAVRHELAALRRDLGVAPKGKEPVLADDLRAMVAALPEDPRGLRDRAMLLLGFAAALRRSELVGLDVGDVTFAKRGLIVTIRRSKSDQEGAGAKVAVAPGTDPAACPVRATRRWLQAARLGPTGPLFRPIHRTGKVLDRRLNPEHVAQLVKHAAAAAGVAPLDLDGAADTRALAGHSLRAGLVTQAALDGVADADIAATTRHKSRDMVARYTRIADPFRAGVAGKIKL
jgi:integrase